MASPYSIQKINNEDDKLEILDESNRIILHPKLSNRTKYNKNFKTDFNEIYDIPKIGKKPDFFPPIFFQHKTNGILKDNFSKNFKTELSETGSVNISSLSFGEILEKINKKTGRGWNFFQPRPENAGIPGEAWVGEPPSAKHPLSEL